MTYVLLAYWRAREDEEGAVAEAIGRMIAPSRAEQGCLEYRAHRSTEDPRLFLLYERYVDQAAYEAHLASEHFQRYAREDAIPRLESRERQVFEPLEA